MSKPKGIKESNKEHESSSNGTLNEPKDARSDAAKPNLKPSRFTIPPWIKTNLTSSRQLKVFFKCWLASWVGFVLLAPNTSLRTLGTSAFFSMLAAFFLPPNMPVQLFLFMIATLIGGLLMGWGIGSAAMGAGDAARSKALLQAASAQLQQSPAFQANPSLAQVSAIFNGAFLDTR
ncbi:hypothetical protein V5O48_014836, partial [Marasmius crinis-equi]